MMKALHSAAPGSGFNDRITMYDGFGSERTYSSYVSCSTLPNALLAPARNVVASTVESWRANVSCTIWNART